MHRFDGAGVRVNSEFVYLSQYCKGIVISADYALTSNFTGEVIPGYKKVDAVLSRKAADALNRAQLEAQKLGLSFKVFDGYRPEKAVRFFQEWGKREGDVREFKERFYPKHSKPELFELGYIARRSSHSRGSAVDLTLCDERGVELDMGTIFDFFDDRSHTKAHGLSVAHEANRQLLMDLMTGVGFKNYHKEWWHYSLIEEAFPQQSFDFDIE